MIIFKKDSLKKSKNFKFKKTYIYLGATKNHVTHFYTKKEWIKIVGVLVNNNLNKIDIYVTEWNS